MGFLSNKIWVRIFLSHLYLELNLGSQTRGPHVAREVILCSPLCFLGIVK